MQDIKTFKAPLRVAEAAPAHPLGITDMRRPANPDAAPLVARGRRS